MVTKRTAIRRLARGRFTPEHFAIFKRMCKLRCSCPPAPADAPYWFGTVRPRCPGCEKFIELHGRLWRIWPQVRPWWWPIIESPNTRSPYAEGAAPPEWQRDHDEAVARWSEIEAAMAEYDGRAHREPTIHADDGAGRQSDQPGR